MRWHYERWVRRASRPLVLLGFLMLMRIVVSCAKSEGDMATRMPDSDGGSLSDATDAACEDDSACTGTRKLTCDDFEWCEMKTSYSAGGGFASVWGSGANDVWAVGTAGSVIHWDGNQWTSAPVATDQTLQAIWGTGPNDVWAVSAPSTIFRMTGVVDGTVQWSPITAIADGTLDGVQGRLLRTIWGTLPSDIWVGGDFLDYVEPGGAYFQGAAWRSIIVDGGPAWAPARQISSYRDGTNINATNINAIWGSGPDDIWLVGSKSYGPLCFGAHTNGVAAADGGIPVWTEFDMQSISVLYAVWGSGPGDVWTVGDHGTIRHFTAGAGMWRIVDSPTTENLHGLWGAGPDDIWAVGEHGTLLHYDGTTWRTSTGAFPPGEKPDLRSVWGSGASDVWAVGNDIVMHFSGPKPRAEGVSP